MEIEEYARIAAAEDEHWWYRNTRAVMGDLLAPWLGPDRIILDAGCGPGGNGAWLSAYGQVVGVDIADAGLAFVKARHQAIDPVCASLERLPFPDRAFDVVVAITVLYSVDDDRAAARELARTVRPGGALLVMEPAFPSLRRAHDKTVHGRRRYRRAELAGRLTDAGLRVDRATFAYTFLAPPAALLAAAERVWPHRSGDAGSDVERRSLDPLFGRLAAYERRWLRRHNLPFGTSVAVVATRA